MIYRQLTDCTEWQFKNIPQFTGGRLHPLFADCGTGMNDDINTETDDDTFMHIFDDVDADDVRKYTALLGNSGAEKVFFNEVNGNLFYRFKVTEGYLYLSFMKGFRKLRIILDRCDMVTCGNFGCAEYDAVNENTVFAQYSLYYDAMIRGTSCDCGMNYLYRLRDNSLIIIDGGEMEQATDVAVDDYIKFLRKLTNTNDGEKIRIALWICTHAHNDHSDFFSKLIRFHADEFILERVAFNFPANFNVKHSPSMAVVKERIKEKYPDALYLKIHAGSKFSIANAEIEVLLSGEDATPTNEADDDFPGMNSTSSIFMITADGVRTLFLADCTDENGDVLIGNYAPEDLECAFLQIAHHGINEIREVYECIKAEKLLLPQCLMNMHTRFEKNYENYCEIYGEDNILLANDRTDIFTLENGSYTHTSREHIGGAYDNSEW